jgi:hypothetical protein
MFELTGQAFMQLVAGVVQDEPGNIDPFQPSSSKP